MIAPFKHQIFCRIDFLPLSAAAWRSHETVFPTAGFVMNAINQWIHALLRQLRISVLLVSIAVMARPAMQLTTGINSQRGFFMNTAEHFYFDPFGEVFSDES